MISYIFSFLSIITDEKTYEEDTDMNKPRFDEKSIITIKMDHKDAVTND